MQQPLADQRALVTGASRGLGRAIALALAHAGADVLLSCKERAQDAEAVAQEIRGLGRRAVVMPADLAEQQQIHMLAQRVTQEMEDLNILVCSAGITLNRLIVQTSSSAWDEVLNVNLSATAYLCQRLIPCLQRRPHGAIVLISSHAGCTGRTGLSAYAASKAGLVGLAKSLAAELAPDCITVNVILPGYLQTDMTGAAGETAARRAHAASLLHTPSDPCTVADFIVHLVTMPAVSGQVFNLDSRLLP